MLNIVSFTVLSTASLLLMIKMITLVECLTDCLIQFEFLIEVWLTYELFNKMKIVKKQNIHPMTNQTQNDSTSVMTK